MITIKRIYEPYDEHDGFRILVDRLWPRGISKEKAHLNLWMKEIAPSDELRKWFRHEAPKWEEFKKRYLAELESKKELLMQLKKLEKDNEKITLLYGAKDTQYNQAAILAGLI